MNTYAIVQTGSKQYRVQAGDNIRVESLPVYTGEIVNFDDVLMVSREGDVAVGTPVVSGARVRAQVTSRGRGKKITVFKYKSKVRYRRKKGHRQSYTDLRIIDISVDGESLAAVEEQEESLEVMDEIEETVDSVEDATDEEAPEDETDDPQDDDGDDEAVAESEQADEEASDEPVGSSEPEAVEGADDTSEPEAVGESDDTSESEAVDEPADTSEPEAAEEPNESDEVKETKDGA